MKKSEIEKRLKTDIAAAAPDDFDGLRSKCGIAPPRREESPELVFAGAGTESDTPVRRGAVGRRAAAWILAAFVVVSCAFGLLYGLFRGFGGSGTDGYFLIDVNPSVELSYDRKGRVSAVRGLNEDGEVLLCGLELTGKTYEEAADEIFSRCVRLGYFSAERTDNAVLVSATSSDGGRDENKTERMKEILAAEFAANKIRGVVITGVDNPDLAETAAEYGVDTQKYELIQTYLALGGKLKAEEYATITVRELYEGISTLQKEAKETEISRLQQETEKLREDLFESTSELIEEIIGELEDCIERLQESQNGEEYRKQYEKKIERLGKKAEEIEDARTESECRAVIEGILRELDQMRNGETDARVKALLDSAYGRIETVFDEFGETLQELARLSASAEETSEARLEKFSSSAGGEDFDFEEWQKSHEEEFARLWYEMKEQWDDERRHDLDD